MNEGQFADEVISYEDSADMIDQSEVLKCLDLGHSFIYKLRHPRRGQIVVVNSTNGNGGVVHL